MADDLAERADRLLTLWSSLSMQHVALGAACACGVGGVSLRLDDFELDIVDYLEDAARRSGIDAVAVFFEARRSGADQGRSLGKPFAGTWVRRTDGPLQRLLEDARDARLPSAAAAWMLPRLERTLSSLAEQHGTRSR